MEHVVANIARQVRVAQIGERLQGMAEQADRLLEAQTERERVLGKPADPEHRARAQADIDEGEAEVMSHLALLQAVLEYQTFVRHRAG
jgi:hypothetical protein